MEPRIPRKNVRRIDSIPEQGKERIHKLLKAAKLTDGGVRVKELTRAAGDEVTENNVSYYLQWLKKYGWIVNLGKGIGWQWTQKVDPTEVIGASNVKDYGFRF